MAVLHNLREIAVTVCVDKQALQEYDEDEPEGVPAEVGGFDKATKTVFKYIETTTGKGFYIKLEISKAYKFDSPNVSFKVFVDGMSVRAKHGGKKDIPLTKKVKGVKNMLDNGRTFLMPFKFSDIITSTDDSKLASIREGATRLSVIGEIVVKVYRRGEKTSVHEKAFKGQAMSHSTAITQVSLDTRKNPRSISISFSCSDFEQRFGSFDLENLDATQKAKLQEFLGNLLRNGAQSNRERKIKREREETDSKTNKRSKGG
ncbi:hypothetical protein BPAE_0092g00200 [Botrytis paeoniae]|uniref:DUF7918 domain-containing protein n=1 Tax=Botrytis paeoniae TaxID=278948 RepID=A0A4Z1FTC6_9HELO|nr:hypothetical protein BPAE_0092g00200 [Botrytis paeoniae]